MTRNIGTFEKVRECTRRSFPIDFLVGSREKRKRETALRKVDFPSKLPRVIENYFTTLRR